MTVMVEAVRTLGRPTSAPGTSRPRRRHVAITVRNRFEKLSARLPGLFKAGTLPDHPFRSAPRPRSRGATPPRRPQSPECRLGLSPLPAHLRHPEVAPDRPGLARRAFDRPQAGDGAGRDRAAQRAGRCRQCGPEPPLKEMEQNRRVGANSSRSIKDGLSRPLS